MLGISVVIPVFNKEKSVGRSLQSVLDQTNCPFEVILVDDGSFDGSLELIKTFNDKRIIVLQQKNRGPSAARNLGVQHCSYNYIIFLDADDVLQPGVLSKYKSLIKSDLKIDLCIGSFVVLGEFGKKRKEIITERFNVDGHLLILEDFDHRTVINIASGAFLVKKTLFLSVSGFDENLHRWEITDLLIRINLFSKRKIICDHIFLYVIQKIDNSQFYRTRKDSRQGLLFACNILSYIKDIPDDQRYRFMQEVQFAIVDQWSHGNIRNFIALSKKYRTISKEYSVKGSSGKLYWMSLLPFAIVKLINRFRRNSENESY